MEENKQTCAFCNQPADLKCSACKLVSYCGKEHQKEDWKTHKNLCRAYEIQSSPELGKYLVASRDLSPGDLILTEAPLVFGPRPHVVEEGPVPCPGCCRLILAEKSPRCEGCDFPICNPGCEGIVNPDKHASECLVLGLREIKAINGLHDFYRQDALLALRCLILQRKSVKKFQQLLSMESHMDKRKDTEAYKEIEERVVNYLYDNFLGPLKMMEAKTNTTVLPESSKETLHKICGIIDVNALEINQDGEVSALYPTAYLMEHNCVCNTVHVFGNQEDNYKITIRAALPIKKGSHITTMYTHALWGTQARREHLRETKYFDCKCHRCSDPTELGTFLSALKCLGPDASGKCTGIQLPVDPTDDQTEWVCDKCAMKLSNGEVAYLINQIGDEVDQVQLNSPTVRDLDGLLNKVLKFLHPNHYHVYAIKHSLIQLYGYQQGYMPNQISDELLKRKAVMCRELMEITKKIDPGNARLALYSGVILHELFLANMSFVKRKWDVGIKSDLLKLIKESECCLKEATNVLKYETNSQAGEKLINLVNTSAKDFYKWIERYKVKIND